MDILDHIYNWLVEYFLDHSHFTMYRDQTSVMHAISANIIHSLLCLARSTTHLLTYLQTKL